MKFIYEYNAQYNPKVAKLEFAGEVVYLDTPEVLANIENSWKKKSQVEKAIFTLIINSIYTKCNIEALILTKEMGLPPPIPLPKVESK